MAAIQDTAGIFVGRTLEIFTELERVVGRDGDVAYAQQVISEDMLKLINTTPAPNASPTGSAVKHR